tara:strand:- start:194 stop:604 length:411 start_codon:yes stop_codon:yes gene_type:complete
MIKYNLKCHRGHEFESWFSDSNEFDNLNKKNLLECIFCNSKKVSKSIMSPMVSIVSENNNKFDNSFNVKRYELIKLRKYIETNFEYVGENFSNKVREIYYDKNSKKTIYGTTTVEERVELAEEGIDLISVPWIKDN